jgi:hypothetical protein
MDAGTAEILEIEKNNPEVAGWAKCKCLYHLNGTRNSRVPGHVILIVLYARWDW